jgi:MOSC domain-containing protein
VSAENGPVVSQVWRYPVKSMGGEQLGECRAGPRGLAGDRAWAVQDSDGKLGSGKDSRRFRRMAGLLGLRARYLEEPGAGEAVPPVLTGPDGTDYPVGGGAADAFVRQVTGMPGVRIRQDTGITHFDEVPLTVVGTATIGWLADQVPGVPVDVRRLRPNLLMRTGVPFLEESWLGQQVRIGTGQDAVHAVFDRVMQRCVMVGMAQPGLPESGDVLKCIGEREDHPLCLALGGTITRPGVIRAGDPVRVSAGHG